MMERSKTIALGAIVALIYFWIIAGIQFLLSGDSTFIESVITNVPAHELVNRILGGTVAGAVTILLIRMRRVAVKNNREVTPEQPNEDEVRAFMNSFSILEMVSVQVKTTMNTVLGFLNLSRDERLSVKTKAIFTDFVYTSSSGLLQLFNNLMELYQVMNGQDGISANRIDLKNLMSNLKDKYNRELNFRQSEHPQLVLNLPVQKQQQLITADKNKITTILEALLQNAISFSGEGTVEFGYSKKKNGEFQFFFHSPGSPISHGELESVFSSYLKNPTGLDINYVLSSIRFELAKRLVERMGGELWSSSDPSEKTGFYFTLHGDKKNSRIKGAAESDNLTPDWKQHTILIAEDDDSNFLLLKSMLTPTKVRIERAVNGLEAVDMIKENHRRYKAILMDIMMPVMDGFESASRIKRLNGFIPIIGQTAYCLESEDLEGKLKFFDDFLTKPIWDHELLRMLNKYL